MYLRGSMKRYRAVAILVALVFIVSMSFTVPPVEASDLTSEWFEPEAIGDLTIEWFEPEAALVSSDDTSVSYLVYESIDSGQVHFQWNFSNGLDAPFVDTTDPLLNQVTLKKGAEVVPLNKTYEGHIVEGDAEIWTAGDFKYTKQQVPKLRLLEFMKELEPGRTYTIEFGPDFRSNNDNTLGKTYSWEFTTSASVSDSIAPTWPLDSELTTTDITPTTLTLNWTAATDDQGVTAYKIYQDQTELATVNGNTQTYKVTGLMPSTSYTFKVEAGDMAGNWSNDGPAVAETTAAADSEAPTWPEGSELTCSNVQDTSLVLNWTAATDNYQVASYQIYKDGAELATVAGDTTTYEVTGLSANTEYTFRVDAGDECDNWSEGPSTTVTTPEGVMPAAPVLLLAEVTAKGDISLTFDKPMANPAGTESRFTVKVNYAPVTVTAVELTGTPEKIKLVLGTKIMAGQYVGVSYSKSEIEAEQVKATDGGVLESFGPLKVTNNL